MENNWQPIETAPKNGTWILIAERSYNSSKAHQCELAFWFDIAEEFRDRDLEPVFFDWWMPLPELPS